ncbi:MAG: CoA transferase [Betaproteobacteria bacterium]|nr:CoA transferase [Betaproteobacteria bacterium]
MSTPTVDVLPLQGVLVVALEQAVAAPYCSSRLADAGARVIKIERPEGDFARGYDTAVLGESSYFVWINRGKESISLDLKKPTDLSVLDSLISKADVFIQNLAPGATHRMGLGSESLRARFPTLITCDISGYGETGPGASMKAYDLLVQAESGLVAVSGPAGEDLKSLGRIGVSVCDINAGMNALIGILKNDPRASTNHARTQHRAFVDGRIASLFEQYESAELVAKLRRAQIAYGNVNQVDDLIKHPQLRTKPMPVGEQWIEVPALPWRVPWEAQRYRKAPRIGEHSDLIRRDVASEQGQ